MAKQNFERSTSRLPEPIALLLRLAAGAVMLVIAWLAFGMLAKALKTGRITYMDHFFHKWTVLRDQDPGEFWFRIILGYSVVIILAALGMAALISVFKRVGGRAQRPEEVAERNARRHRAERHEASRLGLAVSDVKRDLPEFSRGNRSCQLVRGFCARYSLPRTGAGARAVWSLLQRTKREGAQLPNYYLLQGDVSSKNSRIEPLNRSSRPAFQISDDNSPSPGGRASSECSERQFLCCSSVGEGELVSAEGRGSDIPSVHGEVSDSLRQALTKVAAEFSEEYFEFEGTPADVAVYWQEWGGASQVQDLYRVLQSLAGL